MICCPKEDFKREAVPKAYQDGKLRDCVIIYYPGSDRSVFGVVKREEVHLPQILKGFDIFQAVIHRGYQDGYFEVIWADGMHLWGRLDCGIDQGIIKAKAFKKNEEPWQYSRKKETWWAVPHKGVKYSLEEGNSFVGDAIACTDGTILHTYWGKDGDKELVSCYNRFYPKGSMLVPKHVIDSYNADMPQWYRNDILRAQEMV